MFINNIQTFVTIFCKSNLDMNNNSRPHIQSMTLDFVHKLQLKQNYNLEKRNAIAKGDAFSFDTQK